MRDTNFSAIYKEFNETVEFNSSSFVQSSFSNLTSQQSSPVSTLKVFQSSGYIVSGLSAVIASLLIICLIATNRSLHTKDFYILAGLAGSDLIRGYGYFHGGIVRILFAFQGRENVKVAPLTCMLQIYQTFMIFGQKASPLVVMFLSIDRLLAVVLFQQYKHFGLLYAVGLVAMAYLMSAIITVMAWIAAVYSMPAGLMVAQTCKTESVTPNWFFCLETGMRFFPGVICCFAYIYALSIVKSKSATISKGMHEKDRMKQSQLTKNVAIIMVIEILFTTLPFGYSFISFAGHYTQSEFFNTISPFSWSLSLFGAAGNFFVYAFKYPKFRRALEKKILRKKNEQLANIPNKTVFVMHVSKSRA